MPAPLRSGTSRKPKSSVKSAKPSAPANPAGVVLGLALSRTGATVATVECLPLPGRGKLILTGNLVGSARDAAQIAVSLVRARAKKLGLDPALFLHTDIHFHVMDPLPAKGGPSIGLPMFMALVSALTKKPVDPTFAFTGELSLTGKVLPVEGIKAKAKAAARAGVRRLYLPKGNEGEAGSTSRRLQVVAIEKAERWWWKIS
jgi:ATP-dependent Lon protease